MSYWCIIFLFYLSTICPHSQLYLCINEEHELQKELHRQAIRYYPTRYVELKEINDLFQADLVEIIIIPLLALLSLMLLYIKHLVLISFKLTASFIYNLRLQQRTPLSTRFHSFVGSSKVNLVYRNWLPFERLLEVLKNICVERCTFTKAHFILKVDFLVCSLYLLFKNVKKLIK